MAVVVRCCCVLAGPNFDHIGRRSWSSVKSQVSGQYQVSGKLAFPVKLGKLVSSFENASSRPIGICQILWKPRHLGLEDLKIANGAITEHVSAHQGMMLLKFPAIALVVTNALMLTIPFDALAETCEADNSVFNMPLLSFVALIGATVGGLLARQRRGELARLNEQLRQINAALRRQAKIESYAPSLSYAPIGSKIPENEVIVDPRKQELISCLKAGKNFLRNQNPEKAFMEFKAALDLAQKLKDPIEEKKAARGLGASLQRQGKYRDAIKYHSMVLEISKREGEDSGNTEAYGAIADCYTELGDLERAAKFYDQYIARLEKD